MTSAPLRIVLVHGIATSGAVWARLVERLGEHDVLALDRPRTGALVEEVAWLAPRVRGAWVVGMSGGATLALALAAAGVPLAGVVAHEPAAGSLAPTLLAPVGAAFAAGGTRSLARTLYGPSWTPALAGPGSEEVLDDAVTARELAMFRSFEPGPSSAACGPVVVTTGALSPAGRHDAAAALAPVVGAELVVVPGAGHLAAHDAPDAFADVVRRLVR